MISLHASPACFSVKMRHSCTFYRLLFSEKFTVNEYGTFMVFILWFRLYARFRLMCCRSAYFISLICLNKQLEVVNIFQNKSPGVFLGLFIIKGPLLVIIAFLVTQTLSGI